MFSKEFRKKPFTQTKVLILILSAILFTAALHISIVNAAPITIAVYPSSAPAGSAVTISGTDATQNGEVRLYFGGITFLATTTANATGGYSVNINAPPVPTNTYSIMALDVETGDTASAMLTIEPRILLTPTEGSDNLKVYVKGAGFQVNNNITLKFDGKDVTQSPKPRTNYLGSFEASFNVLSRPNGTYLVTADDTSGNTASALFNVVPTIIVFPPSGGPSALSFIYGYGFAPSVNAMMHFDSIDLTPYPGLVTNATGYFSWPFYVPDVSDGIYTVSVSDVAGNIATAPFAVPTPILTLTPDRTFESSIVTARGIGFPQNAVILLHLEDVVATNLIDLLRMSQNLISNGYGSFEHSFIVPFAKPGMYTVSAYQMPVSTSDQPKKLASASLTIADNSPLDVQVNVGTIHFIGEIAEFYVKTAFNGTLVNVTIDKATLYYSNGSVNQDLSTDFVHIAAGVYRIPYEIFGTAPLGTYTLVVQVSYATDLIEAFGTSSGTFLISPALTGQNAQLIDIQDKIGTIIIPDLGIIKANLTAINARLVSIDGKLITLQSDIGTLKTDADTINARLISIEGNEATIQSDLGTLKANADAIHAKVTSIDGNTATISSDLGTIKSQLNTSGLQMDAATLILSLIAAVGATLSAILIRKTKPTPPASSQQPSSPAEPKPPTEPAPATEPTPPPESTRPTQPTSSAESTESTTE